MDTRCPLCGADLGKTKPARSLIARMNLDCSHCLGQLEMNVHPAETALVLASVGGAVALAALAYARQSQALLLAALALGMAGAAAIYAVERTWLRRWPRFRPRAAPPPME